MNNGTASQITHTFGSLKMTLTELAKINCHGLSIHVLSEKFWQPAQFSAIASYGVAYTERQAIFSMNRLGKMLAYVELTF